MTTDVQLFNYMGSKIKVVMDDKGEPWFAASSIAEILGYHKTQNAIAQHCKYAKLFKGPESRQLTNSPHGITMIPESDLYRLIMGSKLPRAVKFQDWVTEEAKTDRPNGSGCYSTIPHFRRKGLSVGITTSRLILPTQTTPIQLQLLSILPYAYATPSIF